MADTGVSGALTDGTGIGKFTAPKLIKDFIADALLSAAAALAAAQVVAIPADSQGAWTAAMAIGGAVIHAAYRAALRWAQSPA